MFIQPGIVCKPSSTVAAAADIVLGVINRYEHLSREDKDRILGMADRIIVTNQWQAVHPSSN